MISEKIPQFLEKLTNARRSVHTVKWYSYMLRSMVASAGDFPTAEKLQAWIGDQRYKPSTSGGRYRAAKTFLKWCGEYQELIEKLEEPKQPTEPPKQTKPSMATRLIAALTGVPWTMARNQAIILALSQSGLRVGELVGLTVGDVDLCDCLFTVTGKGDKVRFVPVTMETGKALLEYVELCPVWNGNLSERMRRTKDPLFWGADGGNFGPGQPMTDNGIRQMLRRTCKRAGIPSINPHSFRHGFAMAMIERGADVSFVADLLGHENSETTRRFYLRWNKSQIRDLYDQFWTNPLPDE